LFVVILRLAAFASQRTCPESLSKEPLLFCWRAQAVYSSFATTAPGKNTSKAQGTKPSDLRGKILAERDIVVIGGSAGAIKPLKEILQTCSLAIALRESHRR
jgi:hypothetical protein